MKNPISSRFLQSLGIVAAAACGGVSVIALTPVEVDRLAREVAAVHLAEVPALATRLIESAPPADRDATAVAVLRAGLTASPASLADLVTVVVRADPAGVDQIVDAALDVAPNRALTIVGSAALGSPANAAKAAEAAGRRNPGSMAAFQREAAMAHDRAPSGRGEFAVVSTLTPADFESFARQVSSARVVDMPAVAAQLVSGAAIIDRERVALVVLAAGIKSAPASLGALVTAIVGADPNAVGSIVNAALDLAPNSSLTIVAAAAAATPQNASHAVAAAVRRYPSKAGDYEREAAIVRARAYSPPIQQGGAVFQPFNDAGFIQQVPIYGTNAPMQNYSAPAPSRRP